jgi:DNA-binding transcriptional ArsR family regulator
MQQAGYAKAATVQAHDPASDPPSDAQLDAMFMALADPTRRAIIRRLTAGEATVTELARPFSMSQPAISKHLKVLERAGLVSRRRDAQRRPCRLEARRLRAATDWLDGYRRYWDESYDNLDAVLDDIAAEEARADEAASGEPEAGGDGAAAPRSDS